LAGEDVVELHYKPGQKKAYAAANSRILEEATAWAASSNRNALAVVVWNGSSRGTTDLTDDFRILAIERQLEVIYVPTL